MHIMAFAENCRREGQYTEILNREIKYECKDSIRRTE